MTNDDVVWNGRFSWTPPTGQLFSRDDDGVEKVRVVAGDAEWMLKLAHGTNAIDHFGVHAMLSRLRELFRWPSVPISVIEWVRKCDLCQRCGPRLTTPPVIPLFVQQPWDMLQLDYVSGLPEIQTADMGVLAAVDAFSGFVIAQPVKVMTADVSMQVLVNYVMLYCGMPRVVHADSGTHFAGSFEAACQRLQIKL